MSRELRTGSARRLGGLGCGARLLLRCDAASAAARILCSACCLSLRRLGTSTLNELLHQRCGNVTRIAVVNTFEGRRDTFALKQRQKLRGPPYRIVETDVYAWAGGGG